VSALKNQKNKRNAQIAAKRGISPAKVKPSPVGKKGKVAGKKGKVIAGKAGKVKAKVGTAKQGGKTNVANKKGAKGKKGAPNKTKPLDGDALNFEMDKYWHKAGKGPDPNAAKLDRELDGYKAKQEATEAATE
jgi:hypothetical protein